MKKKIAIIIMMTCCIAMTGCTASDKAEMITSESAAREENPFSSQIDQATTEAAYSWGIANYDKEKRTITYDGNGLELEIEIDNMQAACEIGFMVFIDGIAQPYRLEEDTAEAYIHPIELEESTKKTVLLTLEPEFAIAGNEHEMYIASMYGPSYRVTEENAGYGNYESILPCLPWKIKYAARDHADCTDDQVQYTDLPDEVRKQYIIESSDGTTTNKLDTQLVTKYVQNGTIVENAKIDVSDDLTLQLYGGENQKYRICAMVDHCPVSVFGGKAYCDVVVESGRMAEVTVGFQELSEIQNYSPLYFVLCPIDETGYRDNLLIDKTSSAYFVRE